jgi:carboxylesterase
MALEWGWIKRQKPVAIADRGISLSAKNGCVVLLLHGLTGTPTELAYIAYHLRHRGGHSVRVPRLANHGQPLSVLARTTWRQLHASAKEAFLEARIAARAQKLPLVVGGLSLGAVLSLTLAAEYPDDVAGVACLSPTLFYDGWNVPWYQKLLPMVSYTPLKYFSYFRESEPYGLKDEELRSKIANQYGKTSLRDSAGAAALGYAHFPVRLFCEMRPLVAHCKRALPAVTSPVLLVQAENDDMTGPKNAEYILGRVGSARRELVMLKQSYHLVTVDLERDVVAERLQAFCDSLAACNTDATPATAGRNA